jgi:AhpD family alkylhydroperoxidase
MALTVAEINGCGYCLSAHTLLGGKAGLKREDIAGARRATAGDDKADAILKLARAVTLQRGNIADAGIQSARSAGLNDAEIVEVIVRVALNVLTNYVNNVAHTVVDFPEVKPGEIETAVAASH